MNLIPLTLGAATQATKKGLDAGNNAAKILSDSMGGMTNAWTAAGSGVQETIKDIETGFGLV